MWKFHDFSITQILREINLWDSRSIQSAILTHLEALNFDSYAFFACLEVEIFQMNKIQSPKNSKNGSFRTFRFSKVNFTKNLNDSKIRKFQHCAVQCK